MRNVAGVSAFGLKDCVADTAIGCREQGFYLADAVLPMNPFGRIRAGAEAEEERVQTGLHWPPEARICGGEPLRRAPISCVWRALVEAGDRISRWNSGNGVSFPLSRILAAHLACVIAGGSDDQLVVAIPDNLDEFGQDALLRELAKKELRDVLLVWRPVAAALSWLNKVEGDFPIKMGRNDHIHVVYLGPDALEFTTFRLRVKEHNNRYYVLPVRDRPKQLPRLTGMDWAGRIIEESFWPIEEGAFWQAFTNFPEVWQLIAGKDWNFDELPRPWSRDAQWSVWNPSPNLHEQIQNVSSHPCGTLRSILRSACRLDAHGESLSESMEEAIQAEIRRMANLYPEGKLKGMILCGPLVANKGVPTWLSKELQELSERGLVFDGNLAEPKAGRLWVCAECDDPVADGAVIYGQRTFDGTPSYLDTLPQLSVLAQGQGHYSWVPLLDAQEVWGGEEFKETIQGRFKLNGGRQKLNVYLYKGSVDEVPVAAEGPADLLDIPFEGVTPCYARLVREVVRRLGSLKDVQRRGFFCHTNAMARYGLAFGKALYIGEQNENDGEEPEHSSMEMTATPFRRTTFEFPLVPPQDVVLDVEVRIRPAAGLARVELLPKEASFLQGRKVQLNYSKMRVVTKLPKRQRGWPGTQELVTDPDDSALIQGRRLVEAFERTPPASGAYEGVIDSIRDHILKSRIPRDMAGLQLMVHSIDRNGCACTKEGNEIIERIAFKFENDLTMLNATRSVARKDRIFTRATWLYASAPKTVNAYITKILSGDFAPARWLWAAEAASRSFVKEAEFRFLFNAIARRASRTFDNIPSLPHQAAKSICRVLMFRKNGDKGLDSDMANLFAFRALERLRQEERQENFQNLYFELIELFYYLLRFRRSDPSCFDPSVPQTIKVFEDAMASMENAKNYYFSRQNQRTKADKVQYIIDGLRKYLYYEGTEDVLTVLGEMAGDMA